MKHIHDRLRRLEGQIRGINTQIEQQATCEDVITQLLAARGSLDGALRTYIDEQLDACTEKDTERMRHLLHALLKHTSQS